METERASAEKYDTRTLSPAFQCIYGNLTLQKYENMLILTVRHFFLYFLTIIILQRSERETRTLVRDVVIRAEAE